MPKNQTVSDRPDQLLADSLRQFKAEVFQVLAHPTRVHIVESLGSGELSVGELLTLVNVEPANLSQHLALLRSKGLVLSRKEGNQAYYRLRDPLIEEVMGTMRKYFQNHLEEALRMLKEMGE